MDLKAFKGMPHEFGGIDYTEGSEVEGGEFAVNIGKSGNEYIFDKESSEGAKLSREYKRLDKNGRLGEDDPIALETFNQIAKEEALKHAQRSVNEKGVDPFRNMYDEGGQAANGGVKYAAGGAKDMYITGGGMGSMMGGMSGGSSSTAGAGAGIGGMLMGGVGAGLEMFSQFKTPDVDFDAMFTPDADPMFANPQRYQNLASPQNTAPAGNQLMTGVDGLQSSVAPGYNADNIGKFESGVDDANKKAQEEYNSKIEQGISAGAGIGGMIGNLVRGDTKAGQLKEPVSFRESGNKRSRSKGPEFHKMEGKDYAASHLEGAASGAMTGLQTAGPWGALAGAVIGGVVKPISDKVNEDKIQKEATAQFNMKLKETGEEETRQSMMNAIAMDVDGTALIDKDRYAGVMRDGGAKKGIYGYYANGGVKKNIYRPGGVTDPTDPKKKRTVLEVNPENVTAVQDNTSAPITPLWDIAQQVEQTAEQKADITTTKGALEWNRNWINSPMHKEMLTGELQNSSGDYSVKDYTQRRLENIDDIAITKHKHNHPENPNTGGQSITKTGDINLYPARDSLTGIHEVSHSSDRPSSFLDKFFHKRLIPDSSKEKINDYRWNQELQGNWYDKPISNPFKAYTQEEINTIETENKEWSNYVTDPTETRARLNSIRAGAQKLGIYDPFTEKLSTEQMRELTENSKGLTDKQGFNPFGQLNDIYTEEEIMDMLNTISYEESSDSDIFQAKQGGVHKYKNGGGKEKEEVYQGKTYPEVVVDGNNRKAVDKTLSYNAAKDPVQQNIMQNYLASNDTKDRMSQAAVGSGDEMYAPYRVDNTCVAGINCFEDLAGVEGIPDDAYNNRALKKWLQTEEGKKTFESVKNEKPGDYVQYEKRIDMSKYNIPTGKINRPYHLGMVTGDNRYLGDGSSDNPLYYNTIHKQPSVQLANVLEFNNINPNFYRMRNKKDRQKVLDAALQAKQQGKDVIRPTLGQEATGYLPLQQYRKNSQYPTAGL